ncbi:MAG: rod shape-determining protein MreD [Firmicutes bacterium ADurb.Bin182]|nr:MAG: rod shape-determining protein MreD [Firmicutes bacterium ADurb.Bin182]
MRKFAIFSSVLLCIYLDSIFFDRINLYGIRPDCMLALIVVFGILMGSLPAAVIGTAAGLVTDIFFGESVGYNAALFLILGMAAGFFYRKYYADNLIIPALTAGLAALSKELVNAGIVFLSGIKFSFTVMFLRYILPSSLMTAVLCIIAIPVLKPVLSGQYKKTERNFFRLRK